MASPIQNCLICDEPITDEKPRVSLTRKGLESLKEASKKRNDNKFASMKNVESVNVHSQCRHRYTRKRDVMAAELQLKQKSQVRHICN